MQPKPNDQCLKVFLTNGTANQIKFNEQTDFASVIALITGRLSADSTERPLQSLYALGLITQEDRKTLGSRLPNYTWFNRNVSVISAFEQFNLQSEVNKVELRVRYFAYSFKEIFQRDRITFYYLYDQIKNDYVQSSTAIDVDVAVHLACLEIRRLFKDVNNFTIDKKSNFEYLEKELGLHKFFPASVISSTKSKQLRKQIQNEFKSVAFLDESQCMIRFLDKVHELLAFTEERFKCEFGTSWSVPVQLVIGCNVGISFQTDSASGATLMANFEQVQSLKISRRPDNLNESNACKLNQNRYILQLNITGTQEPLCIICLNLLQAEQIAELIDSYCCLVQRLSHSIWIRTASDSPEMTEIPLIEGEKDYAEIVEEDADYCTPIGPPPAHLQLDRQRVRLLDVIGEGQFGNVFRAEYLCPDTDQPQVVAVKTCKAEAQAQMGARFLQEAHSMGQLHHPHIIQLIGVCSGQPTWLVIEFAALGQLRSYLLSVRPPACVLLSYAQQLCDALAYLESQRFVHRDIAARNLLVSTPECIKLADFGLSRLLHSDGCYYKAGKGKLPIKWMAPESINYRRFTNASDVWMFAVCLWEIFNYGIKPFAELKNSEVIVRLEAGHRLPAPPSTTCSSRLYKLMLNCWHFEPTDRPTFPVLKHLLREISIEMNHELQLNESLKMVQTNVKNDKLDQNDASPLEDMTSVSRMTPDSLECKSRSVSPYAVVENQVCDSLECSSICNESKNSECSNKSMTQDLQSECSMSESSGVSRSADTSNTPEVEHQPSVPPNSCVNESLDRLSINRQSFNHSLQLISDCTRNSEDLASSTTSDDSEDLDKFRSFTVPNSPATCVRITQNGLYSNEDPNQRPWSERLKLQQRQSAADAKWLQEEEQQMFGSNRVSINSDAINANSNYSSLKSNVSNISRRTDADKDKFRTEMEMQNEPVYVQTTQVLLSIKRLVEAVQQGATGRYLRLVRDVGLELKQLLTLVDELMPQLPDWSHREVEMAHKVLASDMSGLVRAMHQALACQLSTLVAENRRSLCQAAHTIVVDSKTLLDTVNSIRNRPDNPTMDAQLMQTNNRKLSTPDSN